MKLRYFCFLLVIAIMAASCNKDEDVKAITPQKTDSLAAAAFTANHPNTLALRGTLTIKVADSTYTFDAATDSIAVVNIYLDNQKYFGITAINKAHTMSFGISSPGYAASGLSKTIAGGQFLLNAPKSQNTEYTLSQNINIPGPGKILLTQYGADSVLAKGTFVTYLGKDTKIASPFYKAVGSFELRVK